MTEQQLHNWNAKHPVGTPVLAWPGHLADEPLRTKIRSEAWLLGSGDAVVLVEGRAGGVALTHVQEYTGDPAEHERLMYLQQAERVLSEVSREAKAIFQDGIDEWRRNQGLVIDNWAKGLTVGGQAEQLQYAAKLGLLEFLQGTVDGGIARMKKLGGDKQPALPKERGGVEL